MSRIVEQALESAAAAELERARLDAEAVKEREREARRQEAERRAHAKEDRQILNTRLTNALDRGLSTLRDKCSSDDEIRLLGYVASNEWHSDALFKRLGIVAQANGLLVAIDTGFRVKRRISGSRRSHRLSQRWQPEPKQWRLPWRTASPGDTSLVSFTSEGELVTVPFENSEELGRALIAARRNGDIVDAEVLLEKGLFSATPQLPARFPPVSQVARWFSLSTGNAGRELCIEPIVTALS